MSKSKKGKQNDSRSLVAFEQTHGGGKIRELQHRLDAEHKKVEALAGVQGKVTVNRNPNCLIEFALIGDTHIGSLYFHERAFQAFYRDCADRGIKQVYHAGDVLDGHRVYRGQEFEVRDIGLAAQCERARAVARKAPEGISTSFITGNHDQSFKTLAGVPTGQEIAEATGWTFLGEEHASVEWDTPAGKFSLMLVHPGGGAKAYALSYPVQQQINALEGGNKPDVYAAGHYHKAAFLPSYRNVAGMIAGTFQNQTPFMARQGLAAHVGGWIIRAQVGDGHNSISSEFIAFYV